MSSGCSGSLLGDMATRCALVQVRAVAGPRWGPASSAKMLESLKSCFLNTCAVVRPFFLMTCARPSPRPAPTEQLLDPLSKQASKQARCLLACLLAWTRFWKSDGTILRFLEATLHRGESRKPGARKKKDCLPDHRRLAPPLVQPAVAHSPPWRCGDGLESLAAGGCALLVADAIEVSRARAADARQVRAPAAS